jgi:cell wall-associated NlpC family hydrolase
MPNPGFPLLLTSPLMAGPIVREAQRALAGANVFDEDYEPGVVDAVYGEATARAVKRAKWWMGYPEHNIRDTYGLVAHSWLTGQTELPRDHQKRRAERKAEKARTPLRLKALEEARKWLGTKESPPESNRCPPFTTWYQLTGPWCAMFASYCYRQAGSRAIDPHQARYAYCPYIVNDARAGRNWLAVTRDPKPGDLVLYDWQGNGVADHVGLFEQWTAHASGFRAIEGNTSPTSDSNGGAVMRRDRHIRNVQHFVHVGR